MPFESVADMIALSQLDTHELAQHGYSVDEIYVIKGFPNNYANYQDLQTMMEEGQYRQVGYRNRSDFVTPRVQEETEQTRIDVTLEFCIQDFLIEETRNQTKLRLLAEFIPPQNDRANLYYVDLRYPQFGMEEVYALARYIDEDGTVRNFMLPVEDHSYYQYMGFTLERKRNENGVQYELQSCTILLDIEADTMMEGLQFRKPFEATCGMVTVLGNRGMFCSKSVTLIYDE